MNLEAALAEITRVSNNIGTTLERLQREVTFQAEKHAAGHGISGHSIERDTNSLSHLCAELGTWKHVATRLGATTAQLAVAYTA